MFLSADVHMDLLFLYTFSYYQCLYCNFILYVSACIYFNLYTLPQHACVCWKPFHILLCTLEPIQLIQAQTLRGP